MCLVNRRGGGAAGVKAAAGHLTGLIAHAAHAGLYAAGLGCCGYRFLVTRLEDGRSMAIFLECYQARRSVRTVLVWSLAADAICTLLVLGLVALRVSNRCKNAGSIDIGKLFDRFYRADPVLHRQRLRHRALHRPQHCRGTRRQHQGRKKRR